MRLIFIIVSLLGWTVCVKAQDDMPTNSFASYCRQKIPSICYEYDSIKQIHNYSNNWDFDKDGIADQVYFIGTGGAHLYFYLRVLLSSDNAKRDFPFIESDFPMLPPNYDFTKTGYKPNSNQTFFAVFKNEAEDNLTIFIKLDNATFSVTRNVLKKKGVNTNLVTLSFNNGKTLFKDFTDNNHAVSTNGSR